MFNSTGTQVAEHLCNMFINNRFGGLQFYDESAFNEQIRRIVANFGAIFVVNFEWILLLYVKPKLAKPMRERILVNFFPCE